MNTSIRNYNSRVSDILNFNVQNIINKNIQDNKSISYTNKKTRIKNHRNTKQTKELKIIITTKGTKYKIFIGMYQNENK